MSELQSALVAVFMLLLMFGMGASLSLADFRAVLGRPRAVAIGLASQFGWMPLIAFGLALALELPDALAIGLIVMGSSSGGTSSNFFTYVARADLALSISMTIVSTVAAVVLMPLVIFLYARPFTSAGMGVPYGNIVTTLIVVLIPVSLGVWLRSRRPAAADRAERIGTVAGWSVLGLVIAGSIVTDGERLFAYPAAAFVAATLLGPIGFVLGGLAARALGLAGRQAAAVSLETGIQNAPLALGVVMLSFEASVVDEVLTIPLLYGVIVVPFSALAAFGFRRAWAREAAA